MPVRGGIEGPMKDIFMRGGIELLTCCTSGSGSGVWFFYFVKSTTNFEKSNTCKFWSEKVALHLGLGSLANLSIYKYSDTTTFCKLIRVHLYIAKN